MTQNPVDAVFTWVDGADPIHRAKRAEFAAEAAELRASATAETRFADAGELRFAITLLRRHAPWLHRIYLVTDDQRPAWLTAERAKALRVRLVDHSTLFRDYTDCLPTFNSRAIEAMLDRIPGLAERFLYLNDDFFVVAPVERAHYFTGQGHPRFRGAWRWYHQGLFAVQWCARHILADGARVSGLVGRRSEKDYLGGWRFFAQAHAPYPIERSSFRQCMNSHGRRRLVQHRFRSSGQARPVSLYANRMLRAGGAMVGPQDWRYLEPETARWRWRWILGRLGPQVPHLCVQSMDRMDESQRARIFQVLEESLCDCNSSMR